jgi:hypothetical protein
MYVLTYSRFFNFFVAKVEFFILLFLAECNFSTLFNYSTNMCRTSYEPTVVYQGTEVCYALRPKKLPN